MRACRAWVHRPPWTICGSGLSGLVICGGGSGFSSVVLDSARAPVVSSFNLGLREFAVVRPVRARKSRVLAQGDPARRGSATGIGPDDPVKVGDSVGLGGSGFVVSGSGVGPVSRSRPAGLVLRRWSLGRWCRPRALDLRSLALGCRCRLGTIEFRGLGPWGRCRLWGLDLWGLGLGIGAGFLASILFLLGGRLRCRLERFGLR